MLARHTLLGNPADLAHEPGLLPEALKLLSQPNPSPQDLRSARRLLVAAVKASEDWAMHGVAALTTFPIGAAS